MVTRRKIVNAFLALLIAGLMTAISACSSMPLQTLPAASQSPPPVGITSGPALPSVADAVAAVYPSVVTITTEATTYSMFRGSRVQTGAGSGWIYSQDGVIVTNNHVVEGAEKVTVGLADGRTFQADKVRRDPFTDLAIVQISATDLLSAMVGDTSQLRVGDWVVAVGNPLGQGLRAKEGTVSGLKVSLTVGQGETLYDLVETSAAINPGNSGGPLVNMAGEVIGITSAKISTIGVEGMGYAISTRTALPIIEQLIGKGYVARPWLGADFITVDQYVARVNRLPVDQGAAISEIVPGSPAEEAGLEVRDVVIRFQGEEVTTAEGLTQRIHSREIGQDVELTFVRGGDTRTVHARLVESPPP